MARVAILADIHGNFEALKAVMADIEQMAPDQVVVDGDLVNRGPQSQACVRAIRATGWPVVYGNHEDYVLALASGAMPDRWDDPWWLPPRRVAETLTADELAYLRDLPRHYVIDVPGLPAIRVLHGSMRALNDGIGFWMTDAELLAAVEAAPEPIVVGAHTHRPFDRHVGARWALNCGSVGSPFNGDPRAQYLLLTSSNGAWSAEFRQVPYDHAPLYAAWEQSGDLEKSVVARVFKFEVETATFHLASYERFCAERDLPLNAASSFARYREFAADTPPGRSLKDLPPDTFISAETA